MGVRDASSCILACGMKRSCVRNLFRLNAGHASIRMRSDPASRSRLRVGHRSLVRLYCEKWCSKAYVLRRLREGVKVLSGNASNLP